MGHIAVAGLVDSNAYIIDENDERQRALTIAQAGEMKTPDLSNDFMYSLNPISVRRLIQKTRSNKYPYSLNYQKPRPRSQLSSSHLLS